MKVDFTGLLENFNAGLQVIANRFGEGPGGGGGTQGPGLLEAVEQAHREWEAAQAFFEMATDPDLVDYAIFRVQAAQKRFSYLLRQARETGICGDKNHLTY